MEMLSLLNLLILPCFYYLIRLESRIAKIETEIKHLERAFLYK